MDSLEAEHDRLTTRYHAAFSTAVEDLDRVMAAIRACQSALASGASGAPRPTAAAAAAAAAMDVDVPLAPLADPPAIAVKRIADNLKAAGAK